MVTANTEKFMEKAKSLFKRTQKIWVYTFKPDGIEVEQGYYYAYEQFFYAEENQTLEIPKIELRACKNKNKIAYKVAPDVKLPTWRFYFNNKWCNISVVIKGQFRASEQILLCHYIEGVSGGYKVYLIDKRDDKKAIELFSQYLELKAKDLQREIDEINKDMETYKTTKVVKV